MARGWTDGVRVTMVITNTYLWTLTTSKMRQSCRCVILGAGHACECGFCVTSVVPDPFNEEADNG